MNWEGSDSAWQAGAVKHAPQPVASELHKRKRFDIAHRQILVERFSAESFTANDDQWMTV